MFDFFIPVEHSELVLQKSQNIMDVFEFCSQRNYSLRKYSLRVDSLSGLK